MPHGFEVYLTPSECWLAAQIGALRQLRRLRYGGNGKWGQSLDDPLWDGHIEAVASELALAKHRNVYYLGMEPRDVNGDVDGFGVRQTSRPNGCLLIHPEDHGPFYLALGKMPKFRLLGPVDAERCKQDRYWRTDTGRPCWFYPQSEIPDTRVSVLEPESGDYWVYPSNWDVAQRSSYWSPENGNSSGPLEKAAPEE